MKIEFGQDYHPEFNGYVWEEGGGIWLSFIVSKQEGKGNFSRYLRELQEKYDWIKVPTSSILMRKILLDKGFCATVEYDEVSAEMCETMLWKGGLK